MKLINALLKEPVLHFLLAGAILYIAFAITNSGLDSAGSAQKIIIDRNGLLSFMQFRANAFDVTTFEQLLDNMSEEELNSIIDDYVTEEVLFREAKALGLEASDYIIRQRMIQKMHFLLGDLAAGETSIDESELQDYFEKNKILWQVLPAVTFTHVFFDSDSRGSEQAYQDASILLAQNNAQGLGFNDAPEEGDRFPFMRHYVERTLDYVQGQFGAEFTQQLQTLSAAQQWQGPIRSSFGWHIILLTQHTAAAYPLLSEVRSQVESEFLRARSDNMVKAVIQRVRDGYEVEVKDLHRGASPQ